jgi:predicted DNA-binding transcriptional regulator AlpA
VWNGGFRVSSITLTLDGIEPLLALVDERVEQKLAALDVTADRPLDSAAAAAFLGVSRRRIHDLVNEGKLPRRSDGPGCKLWFLKSDLDAYTRGELTKPSNEGRQ